MRPRSRDGWPLSRLVSHSSALHADTSSWTRAGIPASPSSLQTCGTSGVPYVSLPHRTVWCSSIKRETCCRWSEGGVHTHERDSVRFIWRITSRVSTSSTTHRSVGICSISMTLSCAEQYARPTLQLDDGTTAFLPCFQ